ncbi:unnamed protein product, partial [Mesorhabditis spiculigera]
MGITGVEVATFIYAYVLPCQVLIGCCGNIMNLIVLLDRQMRKARTHLLFAAMALSDLAFLISSLGTWLMIQRFFPPSQPMMDFLKNHRHYPNGLCNWFSAMSIYFMIYATAERVSVIKSPFRASKEPVTARFAASLLLISVVSLAICGIHFMSHQQRKLWPDLQRSWIMAQMLLVVVVPFVLTTFMNAMLIVELKKNRCQMHALSDNYSEKQILQDNKRSRDERKITIMVVVISTSFIVCNAPGAVIYTLKVFELTKLTGGFTHLIETISNCLAVTGKVLNFFLFCSSSQRFRKLLRIRLENWRYCRSSKYARRSSSKLNHSHSQANRTLSMPMTEL